LKVSYKLPSRPTITDNHLVQLYVEACRERDEVLEDVFCCTLLWDGWTDVSHQSIYALMVLLQESSELLDIVIFSKDRHTAENMLTMAIDILQQSSLRDRMLSIKGVTTDSPNVTIKGRRRIAEKYNHMITLPCAWHVANTFCKDICKIYRVKSIVKRNCAVVNFFVASHV